MAKKYDYENNKCLAHIKIMKCKCGKEFAVSSSEYIYKLPAKKGLAFYCSYTCFREEQKKREKTVKKEKETVKEVKEKGKNEIVVKLGRGIVKELKKQKIPMALMENQLRLGHGRVNTYLTGTATPNFITIYKISQYLKVSIDSLMEG